MNFISSTASSFIPASHEDPANPGVLKRVIATKESFQAGQVQMLNWAQLPVGSSFQPHYHEDMQEVFVLLCGAVTLMISGRTDIDNPAFQATSRQVKMKRGDTVIINPEEVHEMRNVGDDVAEYIVFGISPQKGGRTVVVA
jgi:mannose-6-phosphate isomerase-like protein (cupin superfamily)